MQKFIIDGRLDDLNKYTKANRTNAYVGARMKSQNEKICMFYIKLAKLKMIEHYPVKLKIDWYEPNRRKDIDNITFATKFILDALVKMNILIDDSQRYVDEIEHHVHVDKNQPRIEITLIERGD